MKRLLIILLLSAWTTPVSADPFAGRTFFEEFELTQESVFGTLDGVRAWSEANGRITESEIRGGDDFSLADGLDVNHNANVTVDTSTITGNDDGIKVKANGHVTVDGGVIVGADDGIATVADASVVINGGTITGDFNGLLAIERSTIQINGGTVHGVTNLQDSSSLHLRGGQTESVRVRDSAIFYISGGSVDGIVEAIDNSRVNVFLGTERNTLFDGSPIDFKIGGSPNAVTLFQTVTEDTTIDRSRSNYGVLDLGESPPTIRLDADLNVGSIYLSGRSEGLLAKGRVRGPVVADDASTLTVNGSTLSSGPQAILATRDSTVHIVSGMVEGASANATGISANGRSTTTIIGGTITGFREAIEAASLASVEVFDGTISSRLEEGIRLRDNSVVAVFGGSVSGHTHGILASEASTIGVHGGSVDGGTIAIRVRDTASLEVSDGSILGRVLLEDSSTAQIVGGVFAQDVVVRNSANVNWNGGKLGNDLRLDDASRLHISGGEISGDIRLADSSFTLITGGKLGDDLRLDDASRLHFSGGEISGDIRLADSSFALITGGTIGGDVEANDDSLVRLIGHNLTNAGGNLSGQLIDGTPIQSRALALDQGRINLYEGISARTAVTSSFPANANVAVVGFDGPKVAVDFGTNADIDGELLIMNDGRANLFGGAVGGPIIVQRGGQLSIYGTNLTRPDSVSANDDGFYERTISGTGLDGSLFEYFVLSESSPIRTLTAVTQDAVFTTSQDGFAVFDGTNGPTVVELAEATQSDIEVWGTSALVVRDTFERATSITTRENSTADILGGRVGASREAVFAVDSSRVNISGGTFTGFRDGLRLWDDARLSYSGGEVSGSDDGIDVANNATVVLTGGTISGLNDGVKVKDRSTVSVFGGTLSGNDDGISISNSSFVRVSGHQTSVSGGVIGMHAIDDALAEVYGGNLVGGSMGILAEGSSEIRVFGGSLDGELVAAGGTIHIVGKSLAFDGAFIAGTLLDGTEFRLPFSTTENGQIRLTETFYGDANLDGVFNSVDLVRVLESNEFGDEITHNSTWADGDWNGDGEFTAGDLVKALQGGGYEMGPRAVGLQVVPEPAGIVLLIIGILAIQPVLNRRNCGRTNHHR